MNEQLISFKTAKLAKENGFELSYVNDDWEYHYTDDGKLLKRNIITMVSTQSLLQKWLREQHKIEVNISWEQNMGWFYIIAWLYESNDMIKLELDDIYNMKSEYKTYEEALEDGLYQAIDLIKLNK